MTLFSRWSQRKRGLEPEPLEETTPDQVPSVTQLDGDQPEATAESQAPGANGADSASAPPLPEETLPDPDSLPQGSDLTAYLASGVRRDLRRRALRRLFAADHYHQRDGLNDYDDDYRQLKSMSQEVADRLRQWTRTLEQDPQASSPTAQASTDGAAHAQEDDASSRADDPEQVSLPEQPGEGPSQAGERKDRIAADGYLPRQDDETRQATGDSKDLSRR